PTGASCKTTPWRSLSSPARKGLEPPRGSPRDGGRCRQVTGGGMVEPKRCLGPHGSERRLLVVVSLKCLPPSFSGPRQADPNALRSDREGPHSHPLPCPVDS